MSRSLAALGCLLLTAAVLPAQGKKEPAPTRLELTPAGLPVPSLRFTLLPELREQAPGNAALHYRKAGKALDKVPNELYKQIDGWERLPLTELPREEVSKTLAPYKEAFDLLHRGARSEFCDFEIAQQVREKGLGVYFPEFDRLGQGAELLTLKARLQLLEDRPDLALRTLQTVYAVGRHLGETPSLNSYLSGIAIVHGANNTLELVLSHPRTANLSGSLLALPRPFFDLRKPMEGYRLLILSIFPGVLDVVGNPNAGAMSPQQIEKLGRQLLDQRFFRLALFGRRTRFPLAEQLGNRMALTDSVIKKDKVARKALVAAGWAPDKVAKWPHLQAAILHSVLEYQQHHDELLQWQALPYWQAAEPLEALEKKAHSGIRGPDSPAIPLSEQVLQGMYFLLAREQLERQFAALRLIEALRLYAANHEGKLPATLADIKEMPLPVCPLTGKSFEYRVEGNRALLSAPPAPPVPKTAGNSTEPLRYEIILRSSKGR